jgi:hypothetical protein
MTTTIPGTSAVADFYYFTFFVFGAMCAWAAFYRPLGDSQ